MKGPTRARWSRVFPMRESGIDPMVTARRSVVIDHRRPPIRSHWLRGGTPIHPSGRTRLRSRKSVSGIGLMLLLGLLPLLVYWPTVFQRYGFRDDYAILREAQEQPAKVLLVGAAQARPLYGLLLETSFRALGTIGNLSVARLGATWLLGVVAIGFYASLRRLKWDAWTAALTSALLIVIPSAQMLVAWAVAWPRAIALLLSVAAFACAETSFRRGGPRRAPWWAGAVALVTTSVLIYQPDTLLYLTLVAAGLWAKRRCTPRLAIEWLVRHAVTLGVGLALGFTVMLVAFARGLPTSARVALEHDWLGKLVWFAREPLQNALALTVLNHDGGVPLVHRVAALVGVLIIAGLVHRCVLRLGTCAWWKVPVAALLLVGSFGVNLIAEDHWPVYRVLLPLTMTGAVVLVVALLNLGGRTLARFALLLLVIPGIWLARRQSFDLIAAPQSAELRAIETGARRIDPATHPFVYVLTPRPEERLTRYVSWDEFGSLSTDSDWTPKEMLKLAMKELHPNIANVTERYTVATGRTLPRAPTPDVVIDLQHLRH